jgi:hypothetical protein
MKPIQKSLLILRAFAMGFGVVALIGGSIYLTYLTDKEMFEMHSQEFGIIHKGNDIPRACLLQCKGKAADKFHIKEGKLVCECTKIKNTQKR